MPEPRPFGIRFPNVGPRRLGFEGITPVEYYQFILNLFGSSIVAFFPMWELSGTVMTDIKNGFNGSYGGTTGVTLGQPPLRGERTSLSLPGANAWCNAFTAGLRDNINVSEGTIMFDCKVTDSSIWTDGAAHYATRFTADANNYITIYKSTTNGQVLGYYTAGGTVKGVQLSSQSDTGTIHFAITWSVSNDRLRLYKNGAQQGADVTALGTWAGALATATFGAYVAANSGVWSGWMQNALVLNREATPAEVASVNSFSLPVVNPPGAGGFTVIFIPDTQAMVQTAIYRDGFDTMMNWIVANKSTLNIQAVMGEGDIVETVGTAAEWTDASAAWGILDTDGSIPYLAPPGDHDYDDITTHDSTTYNTHFPQSRYTGQSWWAGGFYDVANSENAYNVITIDSVDYLFVCLEARPTAGALTWLDGLLTTHSTKPCILVTHAYLQSDNMRDAYGAAVWAVIKTHDNVKWVGCGNYVTPDGYGRLTSQTDGGKDVHQVLFDTQTLEFGGPWLRVVKFHPAGTIDSETYSPVSRLKMTDGDNEFSLNYPT